MRTKIFCLVGSLLVGAATAFAASVPASSASPVAAQQERGTIRGTVVDAQGNPIIGASVIVKGTNRGASTDLDGNFALRANANELLVVTYVGYNTEEVMAGKADRVVLRENAEVLEEVVVLGYGAAQKKQDLSASVGVVADVDKLSQRAVTSAEGMLQGQLPGVTITADGGDPTSTPSIVIRGQGSRNGDAVLWVVDGIPGAPIPSVNDIESIVVLKDAASAAIYGATSGAGGCVLVTTKKAKAGATSISYDGIYGVRAVANRPHGLSATEQLQVRNTAFKAAGQDDLANQWTATANPWLAENNTDWTNEIFRNAMYQRHNVVLNTGTDAAKNRLSYAYDGDEGTLVNTYKRSHTIHYNGSFDINKYVNISEDLTWRNTNAQGANTWSAENGILMNAIYMPSSAKVYNEDGTYGGTTTLAHVSQAGMHGDAINPVRLLRAQNQYNKTSDVWTTTTLTLQNIVPGLKFTSRFTYNISNNYYKTFTPMRPEVGKPNNNNELKEGSSRYAKWMTENTLTYDKTFGKHTVGALLSTTADRRYTRGLDATGSAFASETEALQYFLYSGNTSVTDFLTGPDANVAIVARLAYSFNDRYFVTASWRRDYAGRLPKDHNYGDFPAVTAAWKISNEKFFHKSDAVSLLKLRASWGRVGNLGSIPLNYKSSVLPIHERVLKGEYSNQAAQYGLMNGTVWGNFYSNTTALNTALTWETSEQWDLGLDAAFLSDRLNVSLDYFSKRTYNLIQQQTMNWPTTIGVDPMYVNLGEITNKGFEAQISWSDKINRDWSYFVNANFSYLSNKVKSTGLVDADGKPGVWTSNTSFKNLTGFYQTAEGEPVNSFFLIKTDGIFQSDAEAAAYVDKDGNRIQPNAKAGDLKFVDYDGDGKITTDDRQYCGSAAPKITYALNLGFTYRDLSVSAMFQGVGGAKALFVGKSVVLNENLGNFNRWNKILDAWSPENTGSKIPRINAADNNGNFTTASDYFLEDASYLRLKNLTIGYDFTRLIRKCSHLAGRNSSFYAYVSGENLFTITKYTGMDPECGGYDTMKYPVSRVFSLGVRLTY